MHVQSPINNIWIGMDSGHNLRLKYNRCDHNKLNKNISIKDKCLIELTVGNG